MVKKVSLREIAAAAGVSPSTVSQILNNRPVNYCSAATREKVRRVASELGYRKNIGYELMHSMPTHTVGIIVSLNVMIQEEHHRALVLALLAEFEKRGFAAFCHIMSRNTEEEVAVKIDEFVRRGVEHFAFVGSPAGWQTIPERLGKLGITSVFSSPASERHVSNGATDGAERLFRHLISRVGENFKFVCSASWCDSPGNNRISALQRIFPEYSRAELMERFVRRIDYPGETGEFARESFRVGREAAERIFAEQPGIGGIAYLNDLLALGGASLLLEKKYRKFSGVTLTGFNDEPALRFFPVPVSTVEFDTPKIAVQMAQRALDNDPCRISIEPIVHIRS